MPSITCNKVVLDKLYEDKVKFVVTIKRFKGSEFVGFHTGFIIHSTRSEVLVCTDHKTLKEGEDTYVYYSDGTIRKATEFIKDSACGHAILLVTVQDGDSRRDAVKSCEEQVEREEICTIAQIEEDGELGIMSGIVVAPNGKTRLRSGQVITRHENKFALTCPHGRRGDADAEGNLIGAPVFTLSGLLAGTIYSSDHSCHGLKFAIHSSFFLDELLGTIHDKLKKVSLSRGPTPRSRSSKVVHVGSKSKRSPEGQINIDTEKRVKHGAKRQRIEGVQHAAQRQRIEDWCKGLAW